MVSVYNLKITASWTFLQHFDNHDLLKRSKIAPLVFLWWCNRPFNKNGLLLRHHQNSDLTKVYNSATSHLDKNALLCANFHKYNGLYNRSRVHLFVFRVFRKYFHKQIEFSACGNSRYQYSLSFQHADNSLGETLLQFSACGDLEIQLSNRVFRMRRTRKLVENSKRGTRSLPAPYWSPFRELF